MEAEFNYEWKDELPTNVRLMNELGMCHADDIGFDQYDNLVIHLRALSDLRKRWAR